MKAAERLAQQLGAHIDESMGAARPAGPAGMFPGPAEGAAAGQGGVVHGGPEKYRGSSRIKDALAIEVDRIVADPGQPRKEFDPEALEALAASLKARGQLQPIRVRWSPEAGRWMVVSGERRWRAARLAGLATIACVEAKGEMSAAEVFEDQLVENCLREDLRPIEQARAFRALMDGRGCSARQLAESLRVSHQAVGRALALLTLPGEIQGQVDSGALAASTAAEVARIEDDRTRLEVAARAVAGDLTRDEAAELARRERKGPGRGKGASAGPGEDAGVGTEKVTSRTFRTRGGYSITFERKRGLEPRGLIDALREVASKVRDELGPD